MFRLHARHAVPHGHGLTAHMAARLDRLPVSWRCDEPFARIGPKISQYLTCDPNICRRRAYQRPTVQSRLAFVEHWPCRRVALLHHNIYFAPHRELLLLAKPPHLSPLRPALAIYSTHTMISDVGTQKTLDRNSCGYVDRPSEVGLQEESIPITCLVRQWSRALYARKAATTLLQPHAQYMQL